LFRFWQEPGCVNKTRQNKVPKARFRAVGTYQAPLGRFGGIRGGFGVIKSIKDRPQAFPKPSCIGTYRSHPRAFARVAFSGSLRTGLIGAPRRWRFVSAPGFLKGAQRFIAGWSSPVARQAHNLKVTGSNPVPATKVTKTPENILFSGVLLWSNTVDIHASAFEPATKCDHH
jgi:hypothetical protein